MFRRAALLAVLLASGCSPRVDPITVAENAIVVQNTTSRPWTRVMITVNDHFTGGAPLLAAGGRLNAPLSQFQSGFGQRYVPSRLIVYKVEVTATDSKGEPVRLLWGGDRKRQP
jgi:hypothetical protein